VDDIGTNFFVFFLGDPHVVERAQSAEDRTTNPDRESSLWGSIDFDLHGGRGEGNHLLLESLSNTGIHGGTSGHDDVFIQVLSDIYVSGLDGVIGKLMDTREVLADVSRVEQSFGATEHLVS
jgi:hypothetical protein